MKQEATSAGFLRCLLFNPEDGRYMLLRKVGRLSRSDKALYTYSRSNESVYLLHIFTAKLSTRNNTESSHLFRINMVRGAPQVLLHSMVY
jgi:hypothetical protein